MHMQTLTTTTAVTHAYVRTQLPTHNVNPNSLLVYTGVDDVVETCTWAVEQDITSTAAQ